jgi:hypothetical protein
MLRVTTLPTFAVALILSSFFSISAHGDTKQPAKPKFDKWYETVSIDKFPCMNDKETEFLKRIVDMQKIEQRLVLLSDHRKQVQPSSRRPASVSPEKLHNQNFVCPPFKGVRNPYPQVIEFGNAAPFERIKLTDSFMEIINGKNKNEKWNISFNNSKGYYEGQNPRGTPINLIPMAPEKGKDVRFLVQYLLWKDKTPPSLTICYREDLHNQCNPYMNPALKPVDKPVPPARIPASVSKPTTKAKS